MLLDARIPVILAGSDWVSTGDALLAEGDHPGAAARFTPASTVGHAADCRCCAARNAAGRALAGLLQDRARGRTPFFSRVVVLTQSQAGLEEIRAALAADPVASACFRLIGGDGR